MYNEAMFALLLWLPRKLIVEKSSIFGMYSVMLRARREMRINCLQIESYHLPYPQIFRLLQFTR